MADLKEKVVLVTGASRGVGRGIAEGLAEAGATLYLTARTSSAAEPPAPGSVEATAAAVEALGGRALPLRVDHTDDEAVLELFRRVESEAGRLDVLVNNAFQVPEPPVWSGAFWEHPFSVWDDQCGVGLRGCYVASALAARLMVQQGSGLIVNLSGATEAGYRFSTAYGVCKAGVDRMAADMAHELAGRGVSALSLSPGPVRTERVMAALSRGQVEIDEGRLRSPRFVGRALAALAMDPDIAVKSGGRFEIEALRKEYRFSELSAEAASQPFDSAQSTETS
jgi:dehydrogenase/reductase SDR family protein 1